MCKKLFFYSVIAAFLWPNFGAFAQTNEGLFAFETTSNDKRLGAEEDIFAAMQALDEVGALLGTEPSPESVGDTVDVEALLAAVHHPEASPAPVQHDVQEAPAKVVAAKHDVQEAPAKVVAAKHDVQQAPEKAPVKVVAPDGTHMVARNTQGAKKLDAKAPMVPQSQALAYVSAMYQLNGVDFKRFNARVSTLAELYQYAFSNKKVYHATKPAVGDLAFFHNTEDRNRDGRWNDWHTLVGIVESIDDDQTISVLVYRRDQVEKIALNLKYPELHRGKKGQVLNSQLRANEGAQKGTSAKCFAGFANLLGDIARVTVVDNWQPGMELPQ